MSMHLLNWPTYQVMESGILNPRSVVNLNLQKIHDQALQEFQLQEDRAFIEWMRDFLTQPEGRAQAPTIPWPSGPFLNTDEDDDPSRFLGDET